MTDVRKVVPTDLPAKDYCAAALQYFEKHGREATVDDFELILFFAKSQIHRQRSYEWVQASLDIIEGWPQDSAQVRETRARVMINAINFASVDPELYREELVTWFNSLVEGIAPDDFIERPPEEWSDDDETLAYLLRWRPVKTAVLALCSLPEEVDGPWREWAKINLP